MAANSTQQERFATMLSELGMSGAEFARRTNLAEVSVSRWRNGTRSIQASAAKQIEATFPQFSALWIQGVSPYRNDIEASAYYTAFNASHEYLSNHENVAVAINLAARNGYSVKLPNEIAINDDPATALVHATIAHLTMNGGLTMVNHDGNSNITSKNIPVTIEHDGTTAKIALGDFTDFADELADFAAVRLARMVKRYAASDNSD
ncbi:DNA-binding transcriptional regulator [Adlercreutzia sp. ZJ242]|uniref:helix-turn-helix domain-containing protein n=1 Tax=Adlercreutzia sp. ZJ242 TaxID=2709409 RepID=UPI0013EAB46B|nr:helix-turn-helix transcriptional regulator [Adlercreutzia sp. ZJ242]